MRPHTAAEAGAVVDAVEDWQDVFLAVLGRRLVFAADEYYLLAGRPFPGADAYEGFPMHEDGVGMARTFELEFPGSGRRADRRAAGLLRLGRRRAGRGLPGAPARRPAHGARCCRRRRRARRHPHRRVRRRGPRAPRRRPRPGRRPGHPGARTEFFGGNIGVTGLLVGEDLARVLAGRARRPPLPAARRLPVGGPLPRRHHPADLPRPGRDRRHRRRRPAPGPRMRAPASMPAAPTVVAIVGRPNVGKSTLVNRIVGQRVAIVEERARRHPRPQGGRGRLARAAVHRRRHRRLAARRHRPRRKVSRQSEQAIRAADVVLFVVDATVGVTEEDAGVADVARAHRRGRSLLVANKVDDDRREAEAGSCSPSGSASPSRSAPCTAGAPATCSTRSSPGSPTTKPRATEADDAVGDRRRADRRDVPAVALVGRPNVGKSTLFNRLIGDDRSVVHDMPGTTRDTIDTVVETRRRADPLRRHRRHAAQEQDRRGHRVLLAGAGPAGRSTTPTSPCSSSTPPRASPTRTSASPSGSTPPAARSWCCSTSGSCSTTPRRAPTSPPSWRAGSTSSATPRCSRSARSPARACTSCCRRWPTPSSATTAGCRPARSTR